MVYFGPFWPKEVYLGSFRSANRTLATPEFSPSLIHGLCVIFASNSRFMCLFQAPLDTCLDSPLLASLSVHDLHFTVHAPSTSALHLELCVMGPDQMISPNGMA